MPEKKCCWTCGHYYYRSSDTGGDCAFWNFTVPVAADEEIECGRWEKDTKSKSKNTGRLNIKEIENDAIS